MGTGRRSGKRPLQQVLGQGRNINAANPLEVHDPKVGSLISYGGAPGEGTTTADGAADGSSLIDSVLTTKPDFDGNLVIITSGAYAGQARDINGVTTAGTVTPHLAFGGQILRGTTFVIAAVRLTPAEVAALTTMVQVNQYYDRVFFDSVTGIAGIAWPIGTPQVPSDVIADVITICAARNIGTINVHGALTLGATMEHYDFFGNYHMGAADVVDLNGQDVDESRFTGLVITGAQSGASYATFIDCMLYAVTGFRGLARNCVLHTSLAVATGNTDFADFDNCTSIQGAVTVTIASPDRVSFKTFKGAMILTGQDAGAVLLRDFSGSLEIDNMGGGTLDIHATVADIVINADCDGGTINIYGNARVTDNSGATVVNDYTKETQLDSIETYAIPTVMGRSQIFEKSITSAANVGDVTVATITDQPCLVESVVIHADAGQTGDMTSCGVFGGAGKVITFIAAADALQADLNAADKQVYWKGAVRLAATKTIVISLVGTGATAVDLTITIKYRACVSGGYLV